MLRFSAKPYDSISAASLAVYRIGFGLMMALAVARFFVNGWIREYYLAPKFLFTYTGFGWIKPWPGVGLYLHFALLGVCALLIALGWFYRAACLFFFVLFTYVHLLEKVHYLNHYYLVSCLTLLMSTLPLNAMWSVDAWRSRSDAATRVPAWTLWVLRVQVGLVYFFAGVAKLKTDWLFHAEPLKIWLNANREFPLFGHWFTRPETAFAFSWFGAVFDLSIVGFLLWRRARPFAYVVVLVFHLMTWRLFHLGLFPWIMMLNATLFFEPAWPLELIRRLKVNSALRWAERFTVQTQTNDGPIAKVPRWMLVFLCVQCVFPLRHWLYPGNVLWTEQGFRFAWKVMLMEKNGSVEYRVVAPRTGQHWVVAPSDYLTPYQEKMMSSQPDMILAFAHFLHDEFARRGVTDVRVFADAYASLNGRANARLVDPKVDLAREHDSWLAKPWILPFIDTPIP